MVIISIKYMRSTVLACVRTQKILAILFARVSEWEGAWWWLKAEGVYGGPKAAWGGEACSPLGLLPRQRPRAGSETIWGSCCLLFPGFPRCIIIVSQPISLITIMCNFEVCVRGTGLSWLFSLWEVRCTIWLYYMCIFMTDHLGNRFHFQ